MVDTSARGSAFSREIARSFRHKMRMCSVREQRANRIAKAQSAELLDRVRQRFAFEDVLVLGAGPSASLVKRVPSDCLVIAVNRSPLLLQALGEQRCPVLWLLCTRMIVEHRGQAEAIADVLSNPTLAAVETSTQKNWAWGVHTANGVQNAKESASVTCLKSAEWFTNDDWQWLGRMAVQPRLARGIRPSKGIWAIKIACELQPRQVFLAGIDLGQPLEGERMQAASPRYASELLSGSVLTTPVPRSTQQQDHPDDAFVLSILATHWGVPIRSICDRSPASRYVPVDRCRTLL